MSAKVENWNAFWSRAAGAIKAAEYQREDAAVERIASDLQSLLAALETATRCAELRQSIEAAEQGIAIKRAELATLEGAS